MSTDATLRALSLGDDLPFCCLKCGHNEEHESDYCTECHLPRRENR